MTHDIQTRQDKLDPRFYHPRYWHLWTLFGLGWSVAQLPYPLQLKLGKGFGRLLYRLGKSRAKITRRNIDICMPQLSEEEKTKLVHDNFESLGIAFVEIAIAYWGSSKKLHRIFKLNGIEHMEAAKAAGKGIFIVGGHITSLELLLRMFSERWPSAVLYKPSHNDFFEIYSCRKRARYCRPIPNKKLRAFLDHMKNGGTAIYLSDQDYGTKNSVFAPFFGIMAGTIKRPPEYIHYSGALMMPVIYGRNPDGSGYHVDVMPPLENYPSGDAVADATRLNEWVEKNIAVHPEQYLWQHRRFKRRPDGEPPLY